MKRVDVAAKLFDVRCAFYADFLDLFKQRFLLLLNSVVCLLRNHHDGVHEFPLLFVLLLDLGHLVANAFQHA